MAGGTPQRHQRYRNGFARALNRETRFGAREWNGQELGAEGARGKAETLKAEVGPRTTDNRLLTTDHGPQDYKGNAETLKG
jgi:hypothetical protein